MRTLMAATALLLLLSTPTIGQKLYRHVDEKGVVTYTDRPREAGQKAEKAKPTNVESPDATRQMHLQLNARNREDQAERAAQRRRHVAQQQRDAEAERRRREAEANPYSPEQEPHRPRVRR